MVVFGLELRPTGNALPIGKLDNKDEIKLRAADVEQKLETFVAMNATRFSFPSAMDRARTAKFS